MLGNETPLVSVLVPVFNAEKYVAENIQAIMKQTYQNLEILMINDGSTDHTGEILNHFSQLDRRIKVIHNTQNLGLIKTLNKGVQHAQGKYIARTDADDINPEYWIDCIVQKMEQSPEIMACGGGVTTLFTRHGNLGQLGKHVLDNQVISKPLEHEQIIRSLVFECAIHHPTVLIRKEVFSKYGLTYDERYPHAEDYKLWLEISKIGKLANIEQSCVYYRIHDNQVSSKYHLIQNLTASKIRLEAAETFLRSVGIEMALRELVYAKVVDCHKHIVSQWHQLNEADQVLVREIIYKLYLSLDQYSYKDLVHFVLKHPMKQMFTKQQKRKIIKKFIHPYKYQRVFSLA